MPFSSATERLVVTAGPWAGWCAAHSLLTKEWIINRTGLQGSRIARYYGLIYVCLAAVTLATIYVLTPTKGEVQLWAWKGPWRVLQPAFWAVALTMGYLSFRFQDIGKFLGLARSSLAPLVNNPQTSSSPMASTE